MLRDRRGPRIPVPKGWHRHVRSAVLHVISIEFARSTSSATRALSSGATGSNLGASAPTFAHASAPLEDTAALL